MTYDGKNECADNPRACRGIIRAISYFLSIGMCFSLAFAPFSAKLTNSGLCVEKSEALADVTPTEYGYQFLEAVAGEAGLSVNDTVATIAGITASSTGLVIANSTGIVFGASGNRALDNLAEAADYPAWDTLDSQDQTAWVNKDNYEASKLNALLDAYGLDQDRDRFYSTGGANFEFSQNSIDQIKRLGRIGGLWANNIGVAYSDLKSAILDRNAVVSWFPAGSSSDAVFDSQGVNGWPSYYPQYVNYSSDVTAFGSIYQNGTRWYGLYNASHSVYGCLWIQDDNTGNTKYTRCSMFSKAPFTVKSGYKEVPTRATLSSTAATYNGETFYFVEIVVALSDFVQEDGITPNYANGSLVVDTTSTDYMGAILFGTPAAGESDVVEVPDYPEEIADDEPIYYPSGGVSPATVWNNYIQTQRPTNPYNPGNETGTTEWKQETTQNVLPLQNIKFDKLFPFCLLTDVKDLSEKIDDTITPGQQSDYKKLNIPMAYASDGAGGFQQEDIELDGQPLYDLLVMAKPFNQIMLLFFLVFSLVMFWKSILTGD